MPANLPPEAGKKWEKVMEAKTPEEKLRALEEFLSAVPKHKGTENLVHWARRRMAQLRREIEEKKVKEKSLRSGGGGSIRYYVEKEGDAQVVVIGPPSSGKSSLLRCLTNVRVEPDEVPFSSLEPIPGMFIYDNIYFQLVKLPSINIEDVDSDVNAMALSMIRNADSAIMVLDATGDVEVQYSALKNILRENGIYVIRPRGFVTIERRPTGGIQVIGRLLNGTAEDVKKLLANYGISNALVTINGEATLDDVEESIFKDIVYKPSLVLINKVDLADKDYVDYIVGRLRNEVITLTASLSKCAIDPRLLSESLLRVMDLIRIYTKEPDADTYSTKPFILKRGSTVGDLARKIHSRFYEGFKYARVWRIDKYPAGIKRVGINYVLNDGDIVEIHSSL
ncbi:OBG GTPase family GTP-binding protein [Vulcanisaeta souniana]|uniref:GTP-binding protein n=1 Tax=Vulcanisaeta souniana JCM 11219 TaxID=1293586 RepID=A0A830EC87_9CREN|nr:TGS domain-containing protein [Vulcanisaeta souniana]BDR92064.1 GTP-binding protein [Vulcanisaeta souniana JCM 11219]GGI68158.1 GTP-binding protein [Vulcanisaeta souniana JCM 11219]